MPISKQKNKDRAQPAETERRERGPAAQEVKKPDRILPRSLPPRIGIVVLAVVAVIMFVCFYIRLSGQWTCQTNGEYVLLAAVCAVTALTSTVLLEAYLYFEKRTLLTAPKRLFAFASLIVFATIATAVSTLVSFAFTCAFIAIILCGILISKRAAYTCVLLMAGMCFVMTLPGSGPGMLDRSTALGLSVIMGGTVAVLMLNGISSRIQPIVCGAVGGAASAVSLLLVQLFCGLPIMDAAIDAAWMLGGCVLSGILATGLLPLCEKVFDVVTDARLNELMNNNNPILKRLMIEAPGTYHHSLIVAVMAESAAEIVGANTLLCKTAAYYHDVGKLVSPRHFKENQGEFNIHDTLQPRESAARIIAHPKDGAAMLLREKFPSEIVRMTAQHHGDSLVYYFYSKAKQEAFDPNAVDPKDFRYPGRKPKSKEDAILMLADCCEAAVRAIKHPTQELIEERVRSVVKNLWEPEDGQLSECELTAKDIRLIESAFIKNLLAQYHERIEYPPQAGEAAASQPQPQLNPAGGVPVPPLTAYAEPAAEENAQQNDNENRETNN